MADTEFRRKLLSLSLRSHPAAPKQTVDVHDHHQVIVTERTDREGDHRDVHIYPDTIRAKVKLSQEA